VDRLDPGHQVVADPLELAEVEHARAGVGDRGVGRGGDAAGLTARVLGQDGPQVPLEPGDLGAQPAAGGHRIGEVDRRGPGRT